MFELLGVICGEISYNLERSFWRERERGREKEGFRLNYGVKKREVRIHM
jgi:hypothetical protein